MIGRTLNLRAATGAVLCALASIAAAQTQNTTTSFQYDAMGNLTQVTDALGHVTKYGYDALNRRTTITDAATGVTRNTYDALDQLATVTDPRNVATSYTVDGLGNLSKTVSADTGTTSNTYDEAGNLKTSTDAKQQTTSYQYDVLNRVTLITYNDGSTTAYQYDQGANGIGRLTLVTDVSGSIAFAYDLHGRMLLETRTIDGVAYATSYRYDTAGRLSGMTYPSGRTIDYVRDSMGRISQINTSKDKIDAALVTLVQYQPFGPAQAVTYGNGQVYRRSFDLDGRIASFTLGSQTQAISYDAASRITATADAANATSGNTYGYDLLDRLTSYVSPTVGQSYAYDAVGNRTQKSNNGTVTGYSIEATSNRLLQAGSQPLTLDANGSTTSNTRNQFAYDARGRMVSATTSIGQVTYRINALGQRVEKITPLETTVFHYDSGGKLIAESTTSGGTTRSQEYVYLGDLPVAVLK
jgi:YD repeat-containing protein